MKKFFVLPMVMVLALLLVACSGTSKTEERRCLNCGESISKDVSFCGYCGVAANDPQSETLSTTPTGDETQPTEQPTETQKPTHTHSYSKNVTAPTCTEQGYTTYTCDCGDSYTSDYAEPKGHSYAKNVTPATCTEQGYSTYTCTCGDTYIADHVNPAHNYVNYVCTNCGLTDANYSAYQAEYVQLTADYNAEIAELQSNIATSQSNIEQYQHAIDNARGALATLSPSCPQWFLQQYIDNWKAYGDTNYATVVAKDAWKQQYNSQKSQWELTISSNTTNIQVEQTNISMYNSAISSCTTQYHYNVDALKVKYGIQ